MGLFNRFLFYLESCYSEFKILRLLVFLDRKHFLMLSNTTVIDIVKRQVFNNTVYR